MLRFRLRAPTQFGVLVPTPVLIPVRSTNYLTRVLRNGFPPPDYGQSVVRISDCEAAE